MWSNSKEILENPDITPKPYSLESEENSLHNIFFSQLI